MELEKYLQLGGVFVLSIFVIYNFFQLLKNKKTNGKDVDVDKVSLTLEKLRIAERLTAIEVSLNDFQKRFDNHIQTIYSKFEHIDTRIEDLFKDLYKKN